MERIYLPAAREIGQQLELSPEQARYLTRVHRLGEGDELLVFDGVCCEYQAALVQVDKRRATVQLKTMLREEASPALEIWLAQGLPKQAKMETILQKSCELGAMGFIPFESQHGVVHLQGEKREGKHERWETVIEQACRQSRRIRLPILHETTTFAELFEEQQPTEALWLAYEGEGTEPLMELMDNEPPQKLTLVIGPEGGFSIEEIQLAQRKGARLVSLGPRILRTETAGMALLAAIQVVWGDMGGKGRQGKQ